MSGTVRVVLLAMLALGLAGCAGAPGRGFDESAVFADPAHYSLYDCKQLAAAHQTHAARVEELKRLMAKAETGPAGSVMSELAYRSDYLSAQAQLKAVNARDGAQPMRFRRGGAKSRAGWPEHRAALLIGVA
ncbi:MAG: hypothetical protein R3D69_18115 [Xanthobacteraceae bacterium]